MQITRQSEYAIRTLIELAKVPLGTMLQTRDISQKQDIPEVFLTKTIQLLARAGLVTTQRGSHGGVYLAVSPDKITIADVLTVTEGKLGLNVCLMKSGHCSNVAFCPVHRVLKRAQDAMLAELKKETFADLAAEQAVANAANKNE